MHLDIIKALSEKFTDFSIVSEKVPQGYDEKTIVVLHKSSSYEKQMKNRYKILDEFLIYFLGDIGEISYEICEVLKCVSNIRPLSLDCKIEENELRIEVKYSYFALKIEETLKNMHSFALNL